MNLSEMIQQRRVQIGKTQKQVAVDLGYTTPQFVSNWERNLSYPPVNKLEALAKSLRMKADDLKEAYIESKTNNLRSLLKRELDV